MKSSLCGKQVYKTPSAAEMGIDVIIRFLPRKGRKGFSLDYYWCKTCVGFHLTRKELTESERQKRDAAWAIRLKSKYDKNK